MTWSSSQYSCRMSIPFNDWDWYGNYDLGHNSRREINSKHGQFPNCIGELQSHTLRAFTKRVLTRRNGPRSEVRPRRDISSLRLETETSRPRAHPWEFLHTSGKFSVRSLERTLYSGCGCTGQFHAAVVNRLCAAQQERGAIWWMLSHFNYMATATLTSSLLGDACWGMGLNHGPKHCFVAVRWRNI